MFFCHCCGLGEVKLKVKLPHKHHKKLVFLLRHKVPPYFLQITRALIARADRNNRSRLFSSSASNAWLFELSFWSSNMTTDSCSAWKVSACAKGGKKYSWFSTTSTGSLKRKRTEDYQSFTPKSARKLRNTRNAYARQKPARTSESFVREKRKRKLFKGVKNSQERAIYSKSQAVEERGTSPNCQTLNRLGRQRESKVLDQSDFCEIHQF